MAVGPLTEAIPPGLSKEEAGKEKKEKRKKEKRKKKLPNFPWKESNCTLGKLLLEVCSTHVVASCNIPPEIREASEHYPCFLPLLATIGKPSYQCFP